MSKKRNQIEAFFKNGSLTREQFRIITTDVLDLSSYCTDNIWCKCGLMKTDSMSREVFWQFYERELEDITDPKVINLTTNFTNTILFHHVVKLPRVFVIRYRFPDGKQSTFHTTYPFFECIRPIAC